MRVVLLAGILVAATASAYAAPSTLHLQVPLSLDEFVAVRFNFSAEHDFGKESIISGCAPEEQGISAVQTFVIEDGRARLVGAGGGSHPFEQHVTVRAADRREKVLLFEDEVLGGGSGPDCRIRHNSYGGWWIHDGALSVTYLHLNFIESARLDFFANWTYGVESWDVAKGFALGVSPDRMSGGALVTTGVFVEASMGISSHEAAVPADAVGWFWPHASSASWCRHNAEPCESDQSGFRLLQGSGPQTFEVGQIDAAADTYGYTFAIAFLPDGSYVG